MIYLKDNPLLRDPLTIEHVKHRLLGHWGASPALSFVWVHLNRLIRRDDLNVIFMAGPGHGAPGVLGLTYLEGTYAEVYPDKSEDIDGMRKFFKQFSFPGHIGSHVTPETPGSIHEGGELGYSVSHAYGAAYDNPDLIVACVVGDGEAETGPLATAWHSGPDETASNRLQALYEVSKKTWMADLLPEDADGSELSRDGWVMEMLSEHTLIGWLEGYLLTGRHGFFHTYEAFAHVVDSIFNQHAKWLDISKNHVPWRASMSSQNILLSSTVWRQDHNGFSHQDPGFIDLVTNKSPSVTRIYLPPDANSLQFLTIDEAIIHCAKGIGIAQRASNDAGVEPDVVMASCGDVATMEALAVTAILRERLPDLKVRFVNVVDLFKLQPASEHPHGSTEREFDSLFTTNKPIIFNFHGYPWLIHKLAYRFKNHANLHVHGYKEKGNINTPMELAILNEVDRFHLVVDVIDRVPGLAAKAAHLKEEMKNEIILNLNYAHEHGTDREEITRWKWPY